MARRVRVRAAVLEEFGSPFRVGDFEYEVPDDWVEVRVGAVGVCGRDGVVQGGGFRNLKPPLVLGHEVFGYSGGRPVGVFPAIPFTRECAEKLASGKGLCDVREYTILGEGIPGGYADRVYVPREVLVPLPDDEFEKYAAAVCGVATFIRASRVAGFKPGDRVLVTGASGGVAVHGIQYLKLLGAEVVAFTRSPEKAKILEGELGVEAVTRLDFYREKGRVDVVIEMVGAWTFNESVRALRPGGVLVLVGNVTGEPVVIERPALIVMREIRITGSAAFSLPEYKAAVNLVASGAIKPYYRLYRLEEVNKAYEDMRAGSLVGRAVLKP